MVSGLPICRRHVLLAPPFKRQVAKLMYALKPRLRESSEEAWLFESEARRMCVILGTKHYSIFHAVETEIMESDGEMIGSRMRIRDPLVRHSLPGVLRQVCIDQLEYDDSHVVSLLGICWDQAGHLITHMRFN